MSSTLCDVCRERAATVFMTKIVNNHTSRQRLCESCARQQTSGQHAAGATGASADSSDPYSAPLEEIMMSLFRQMADVPAIGAEEDDPERDNEPMNEDGGTYLLPAAAWQLSPGEFPADEDAIDMMEDMEEMQDAQEDGAYGEDDGDEDAAGDNLARGGDFPSGDFPSGNGHSFGDLMSELSGLGAAPRGVSSERCPKCNTTWDRLRQDGRAGCAHCYITFAAQLSEVMERVQRSPQHAGKQPRAAEKRRRRLAHLRARRDRRLEMLNRRLQETVAAEKYEEAAKLRDKIKIVSSTIVSDE